MLFMHLYKLKSKTSTIFPIPQRTAIYAPEREKSGECFEQSVGVKLA
jgi:predicted RNase H-like nuclease